MNSKDRATKAKTIGYWATTGLLVFCMTGGAFELLGLRPTIEGIMRLGYPPYIIPALGLGKVLAILAILWPGLPRLKERATPAFTSSAGESSEGSARAAAVRGRA